MKILYAADNRSGSFFQLKRFLRVLKNKNITIKVAAYKKYSNDIDVDWTLDCLLNQFDPNNNISFKNDNYKKYFLEIQEYDPDLIISDLEIFTSYIAIELGLTLWQVSPLLIYHALETEFKNKLNIYKLYSYIFRQNKKQNEYINFIINNSNKKFIYSHFCDIQGIPIISNYNWIRPYYFLSEDNINPINMFGVGLGSDKKILALLNSYKGSRYFSNFTLEKYDNIKSYHIYNIDSYKKELSNSKLIICNSETSILADAFYNMIPSVAFIDSMDKESIINSKLTDYLNLGKTEFKEDNIYDINLSLNDKIKFLDQEIEELCI